MKIALLLFIFAITTFYGCNRPKTVKLTPINSNDSVKVALNVTYEEDASEPQGTFTLSFQNNDKVDYKNCELTFNEKYKHSFEGLFEFRRGMLKSSDIFAGKKFTFLFSIDIDNLRIIGIADDNFKRPDIIEFSCDKGKIIWKW